MNDARGAIVLCGGSSSRMGRDKAWLPFGDCTLLERVVRGLSEVAAQANIVVVAGSRQQLPTLAQKTTVVHERHEGRGPLAALVEGLAHLPAGVDAAFACGCDAPFIQVKFVNRLFELLDGDAVVPCDNDRMYPLAAVYRRCCATKLQQSINRGERSLHRALRDQNFAATIVDAATLRDVDPSLDSLLNCNTLEDYESVVGRALP